MLKPLPIGVQTFSDLIESGFLYVDKTRWIYELVRHPKGVYFLSRPRRFGKSLLLSTLGALFEGRRELFEGLWISDSDYAWPVHPVIRIDFSLFRVETEEELKQKLVERLEEIAADQGLILGAGDYQKKLNDLIRALAEQGGVVILIDEYDKPIIDNIDHPEAAARIREALKGFYTVIKGMDAYVRFVFLTGVSKFSKVGVFSGLNNLKDITLDNRYATLLGFTQEELERDFHDYIQVFAENADASPSELVARIQHWYNGFRFSKRGAPVYNPFSLLLVCDMQDFRNFWFETGTPTFLIKLLKSKGYDVRELESLRVSELTFSSYEIEDLRPVPLLWQTGYLTIKDYDPRSRLYRLSYPNYEVQNAFMHHLLDAFSSASDGLIGGYLWDLLDALQAQAWEKFFASLGVFFAGIPYDIQIPQERYYQTVFYLIFKLMGLQIGAEVRTNRGRIDAVIELDEGVFIFEFKLDGTAEAALAQIAARGYDEQYRRVEKQKPIYHIGVAFGTETRSIIEWQVVTQT
ncbi:MAG: AAA family ATPase [Anaerolineales bacterium]